MCPELERHERELHLDVSPFEALRSPNRNDQSNSNNGNNITVRIDHSRAVKKYKRAAAGNEAALPEDVRPLPVLERTLKFLVEDVLDGYSTHSQSYPTYLDYLVAAQKFVRDRTRAIRQDLTVQDLKSLGAIRLCQCIARYHILTDYLMRVHQVAREDYDPFQNMEQLRKVLLTLMQMYHEYSEEKKTEEEEALMAEEMAEFRAYHILTHLDTPSAINHKDLGVLDDNAGNQQQSIRPGKVAWALGLVSAWHGGDYVRFFDGLSNHAKSKRDIGDGGKEDGEKSTSFKLLAGCLANGHAQAMRLHAHTVLRAAYQQHQSTASLPASIFFLPDQTDGANLEPGRSDLSRLLVAQGQKQALLDKFPGSGGNDEPSLLSSYWPLPVNLVPSACCTWSGILGIPKIGLDSRNHPQYRNSPAIIRRSCHGTGHKLPFP